MEQAKSYHRRRFEKDERLNGLQVSIKVKKVNVGSYCHLAKEVLESVEEGMPFNGITIIISGG